MIDDLTRRAKKRIKKDLRRFRGRLTRRQFGHAYYDPTLIRALGKAVHAHAAIRDHLSELFTVAMLAEPRLIVELGTRGGDSTRAFLAAAAHCDAQVLSVDINPCGELAIDDDLARRWHFVQSDDVAFGREGFEPWCAERGLPPVAELIFIDSSHLYEHTVEEIEVWKDRVAEGGFLLFHDTNMASTYFRLDNSQGLGWDNDRGVIRAIEEWLGRRYDENAFFVDVLDGWLLWHRPNSSGLTVMRRRRRGR